jgi:hypothetical protein
MAASYELINDFFGIGQGQKLPYTPDKVDVTPYWVIAIFPFYEEVTFQRNTMSSYDQDPSQAVKTNGSPLYITSDCVSLQVSHTKSNFQGGLQGTLLFSDTEYLREVFPGNWMLAWMVQSESYAQELITRIQNMDPTNPCNRFMDGLKFVGRVNSCRKQLVQSPTGLRTVGYNLQGESFSEFQSEIYFDPALADSVGNSNLGTFFSKLDQDLDDFFNSEDAKEGINVEKAITFLLSILLGKGVPQDFVNPLSPQQSGGVPPVVSGLVGQDQGVPDEEAPYAFLVPQEVGALLGKQSTSKTSGILAAADLDEIITGVQNYSSGENSGTIAPNSPQSIFIPDGLDSDSDNAAHKFTPTYMAGTFPPEIPQFTGENSVWTILSQYLNPAINEMYTALRTNEDGYVVPTLVLRQIPFTTDVFAQSLGTIPPPAGSLGPNGPPTNQYLQKDLSENEALPVTRFLELPRWHIHPLLVVSADIGRSNSKRFNFVHAFGHSNLTLPQGTGTWQICNNPPIQDVADVKRSGLRPNMQTLACDVEEISREFGASEWMALIADSHMGMHLTLDGTIAMYGVQAPIVPGDNCEFDGVVYHIESVTHSATMNQEGERSFMTTIQVTNGIRSDNDILPQDASQQYQNFADAQIYAGVSDVDPATTFYDPGLGYDAQTSLPATGTQVGAGNGSGTSTLGSTDLAGSDLTPATNPDTSDDPTGAA